MLDNDGIDALQEEDMDEPMYDNEESEDPSFWPPADDDDGEPEPVIHNDPYALRVVRDAQAEEIRELRAAAAKSRSEYENLMRRLDRMAGSTTGASGSGASNRASIPDGPTTRPRSTNALTASITRLPSDRARPATASRPDHAPRPAPSAEGHSTAADKPPPILGVDALAWIPFPDKDTDRTIARIRFGLGASDKETWLNMQDAARQVASLCGFDFNKLWKRQSSDKLTLASQILEKRIPGLVNFEDRWATTRLLQTKFNHRRGHMLHTARLSRERKLARQLGAVKPDLDDPDLARMDSVEHSDVASDLDTEPEQARATAGPSPLRHAKPVATGHHADMPAPRAPAHVQLELKRRRNAPPSRLENRADDHAPSDGNPPRFKKARTTRPPEPEPVAEPAVEPYVELDVEPEPEPEPEFEAEPESKPEPMLKPRPKQTNPIPQDNKTQLITGSTIEATPVSSKPTRRRGSRSVVSSAVSATARSKPLTRANANAQRASVDMRGDLDLSGSPAGEAGPEPPLKRRARPKIKPVPPPSPPPSNATASDSPSLFPVSGPSTRRHGLRSSNVACAATDQTAAVLTNTAASEKRSMLKGKRTTRRIPSEPPSEAMEPELPDEARESDDGFHDAESEDDS